MTRIALILAFVGGVGGVSAQVAVEQPTSFEVASVKPNVGAGGISLHLQPGGRFTATKVTLRELIQFAYQTQPFQIVGDHAVLSNRFDVIATAKNDIRAAQQGVVGPANVMVQVLLRERFQLRLHREQREMRIYALVHAGDRGALGPEIESRTEHCKVGGQSVARPAAGQPTRANWPAARGAPIPCGITMMGTGRIATGGIAMSQVAQTLSGLIGDAVIDRTGMSGVFAFQLDYAPAVTTLSSANETSPLLARPSIFTALQEQLGLKLDRIQTPVEVLVIDSVEHPTPD